MNKCVNHKGGVFNPTGSSTFKNLTGLDLDIPKDRILYSGPDFEHGWATTDVLHFGEQSLKDFLIILSDNSQTEPGDHATMALGPGSELLESLIDKSIIATRSFAYDQGLTGDPTVDPKSWVDGQLTLGGYDKSRFTGELFPIQLSDDLACKAKVVVEQITLRNSTGSIDLMGNQKSKAGSLM